jgi:hypothetical protein
MPWYKNPATICKVLDKIANRYENSSLQQLRSALDSVTDLIWKKQEHYYKAHMHQ